MIGRSSHSSRDARKRIVLPLFPQLKAVDVHRRANNPLLGRWAMLETKQNHEHGDFSQLSPTRKSHRADLDKQSSFGTPTMDFKYTGNMARGQVICAGS